MAVPAWNASGLTLFLGCYVLDRKGDDTEIKEIVNKAAISIYKKKNMFLEDIMGSACPIGYCTDPNLLSWPNAIQDSC